MGDIHPGGNPHYLSIRAARRRSRWGSRKRMGELDPAHTADYARGAQRFQSELEHARKGWEQTLAAAARRAR